MGGTSAHDICACLSNGRTSIGPTAKGTVGASAQCGPRNRPPPGPVGRQRGSSQLRLPSLLLALSLP